MLSATISQADLEACPTEEILIVADPNKVYGEQWYFTFTAEAFETQLKLQTAGAEEEKARQEAEAEVGTSVSLDRRGRREDTFSIGYARGSGMWCEGARHSTASSSPEQIFLYLMKCSTTSREISTGVTNYLLTSPCCRACCYSSRTPALDIYLDKSLHGYAFFKEKSCFLRSMNPGPYRLNI